MTKNINNQAFIDGQNLIMGTTKATHPWTIDWWRLRTYLAEKYNVSKVYYFSGAYYPKYKDMYDDLKRSAFELIFRPYSEKSNSPKKGNVDTDIVFEIMKKLVEKEDLDKILLVSGDGDYYRMVKYLISKDKFEKLLVPNKEKISFLYSKDIPDSYISFLDDKYIKRKLILSTPA